MDRMISDTIGFTPVAIKFVINEAAIHAHFEGRESITYWDFTKARETHEHGLSQPIRNMAYSERRQLAYHEAGHAYAMVKLLKKERLTKVTIIRHGRALGFAAWKPSEEAHMRNKQEMLNDIQISLASRASEELFLERPAEWCGVRLPQRHGNRFVDDWRAGYGRQLLLVAGVWYGGRRLAGYEAAG